MQITVETRLPFKGIISDDISEFESYHLSQAVWFPPLFACRPSKSSAVPAPFARYGSVSASRFRAPKASFPRPVSDLPAVGAIHDRPSVYHYAPKEHGLERRADVDPSVWTALMTAFPEDSPSPTSARVWRCADDILRLDAFCDPMQQASIGGRDN